VVASAVVSRCCRPDAYRQVFGDKQARKDARRYRRKGLPKDAAAGVAFLRRRGVVGLTVLEVGGGVGAAALELLRAGAAGAANVELSPAYAPVAAELVREAGLDESLVEQRVGDFVEEASEIEPVDVVVMNRVVCCYPDYEVLLVAAANRARRYLVFTYPRDNPAARLVVGLQNLVLRLSGKEFRSFVHSRAAMLAVAEGRGLRLAEERRAPLWQTAALERPA
jgi:SAM-dependent methyltransferase